ncbi:TPA: DMT family transporter [Bacillus thuringiensis]|uniref:DMT family transporter n=1 Tax=Bacillus thuringiensis TaxID=1428 RepID=A0A9X6KPW1_BACTU|nr:MULTISPECIES: DMT family transporter [Bacillus cereus group]HDR7827113.1 DMT family transporter [Bacillus anthracis]AJA23065.1 membrane protein [Bacillus thuringiensis serovar galleriae]ETE95997.1 membrane protein [Bacillus thuringiensis serovar aizawai str. Leapi01]ETE96337.1 membrane protein [Bacillus thuringiensis serovar aizawai str. Hu4-2]KAB1370253.1 DMT family transporter [Bacillus thuringiensis]
MFAILLAISFGAVFAVQTAINAQLRKFVISPFLASMISFAVGVIFLTITILISGSPLGIPLDLFLNQPIFIWLGGIGGAIALTTNILLFPKLGSVQTAIMPILGMTLMSMLIDNYGWFNSVQYPLGLSRIFGVLLVLIGVFLAIAKQEKSEKYSSQTDKESMLNQWIWRIVGIMAGMLMAIQIAINGQLGKVLHSSSHAALVSFFVGTIILIIIVGIIDRSYTNIKEPIKQSAPWWIWLGGILGGSYVLINVYLVDQIGNGQTVILTLFGQIIGSLMVEQFGLLNSLKNRVKPIQIFGLIVMIAGVFLIRVF